MTEYITKQEARTALLQRAWKPNEWHDIKNLISSIPPADVRPVRRGRWIQVGGFFTTAATLCGSVLSVERDGTFTALSMERMVRTFLMGNGLLARIVWRLWKGKAIAELKPCPRYKSKIIAKASVFVLYTEGD